MTPDKTNQSNEYIMVYNAIKDIFRRYKLADFNNLNNYNDFLIFGIQEGYQPIKLGVKSVIETHSQKSIELICTHGSIIIDSNQTLFTIDDDCNIIEIQGNMIKKDTPLLIPRLLNVKINDNPLDLANCGRRFLKDGIEYIEQFNKTAKRFIRKDFWLGFILGQYVAEGTMGSRLRPTTILTSSTDLNIAEKVKTLAFQLFGLTFNLRKTRVKKCKRCGVRTQIINDDANECSECGSIYYRQYAVATKKRVAQCIFTRGLDLEPVYSYLKEIPPIIYNAPIECVKGFLFGYFLGDGSRRDYRDRGRTFDLNFETSSRRLIFGLKFLLKRLGVISIVNRHEPPPDRENSKIMYSLIIRGSSNYEILKQFLSFLPAIDYTTTDIKTSANTQEFMKKLNDELQKIHQITLRKLSNEGIIPPNAAHVATQIQRKTNLSEILLLKTIEAIRKTGYITPIVEKMEAIFKHNTFTHVKKINPIIISDEKEPTYNISVGGYAYCVGTAYIYIKSGVRKTRERLYLDHYCNNHWGKLFSNRNNGRDKFYCYSPSD
ncbi:MAG: hypothetical protein EU540_08035 [Promethearchaeota archaeon]|nr:MAG: hypothetical protein EU540_08035 [Candidatus Lokiarchaeota archaeon]